MDINNEEKLLTDEERAMITHVDDDQIVGDNNHIESLAPDTENGEDDQSEDHARRNRNIRKEAEDARERLNRASGEVRDYGSDARETLL